MRVLGYRQALLIYRRVIEETGGSYALRDEGLLRSALARPQASFGGQDLYPTLFEKAAALLESLVLNHPLVDGNKRVAWECLDITLEMNGFRVTASHDQSFKLVTAIIERKVTVQGIAEWLAKHTRRLHS
ncbi:MAG: type II toxin-antitoxin system death-on-curing family toxin [Candidatus Omnitrophica bacterium]|nr:type II toxin-antitoxin system death-on-curing family toxin [Candidatus Omnitrophota bacterium]